jgi:hypothetical protein
MMTGLHVNMFQIGKIKVSVKGRNPPRPRHEATAVQFRTKPDQ